MDKNDSDRNFFFISPLIILIKQIPDIYKGNILFHPNPV